MKKVKTSDPKEIFAELEKNLAELASKDILVGIPKEVTQEKDGETFYLADIATVNNFGSIGNNIPARPFGSTVMEVFGDQIRKFYKKEIRESLTGKRSMTQALNRVGFIAAGFMKQNLSTGKWKPNAPATIAKKGSSKPLIDTGEMRRAITWILRKKSGVKSDVK